MKIRCIRAYSGAEGSGPDNDVAEGSEHIVSRARGNELHANGLVTILEDEADDKQESEPLMATESDRNLKNLAKPENKRAPTATNKMGPKPRDKHVDKA